MARGRAAGPPRLGHAHAAAGAGAARLGGGAGDLLRRGAQRRAVSGCAALDRRRGARGRVPRLAARAVGRPLAGRRARVVRARRDRSGLAGPAAGRVPAAGRRADAGDAGAAARVRLRVLLAAGDGGRDARRHRRAARSAGSGSTRCTTCRTSPRSAARRSLCRRSACARRSTPRSRATASSRSSSTRSCWRTRSASTCCGGPWAACQASRSRTMRAPSTKARSFA